MRGGAAALAAGAGLALAAAAAPPLPEPGSYELPPIDAVAEHRLLATDGSRAVVPGLAPGGLAVVSFVYTHCPHVCPRTLAVLQELDRRVAADPRLADVRLVTVSFDPARDTPERMGVLRRGLAPRGDWSFLTAASSEELRPVLDDYGQDVLALVDAAGHDTGILRHVLKVFLVDDRRSVRNVYSAGFLSAELVWRDLHTLRLERERREASAP